MKYFLILTLFILGSPLSNAQAWKGIINQDLPALKKKADAGDPAAMAEYAFHSLRCMGDLTFQPKLIFEYFTKSAEAGNHEGQVGLAHCYCFNVGTIRNVRKANQLIQKPFEENHPVALKIMGYLHYGHHHVKKRNLSKVREFNRKSAALGCIAAQYNLGVEYVRGGPGQELEKGMKIFRELHEKKLFPMASAQLFKAMQKHKIWDDHKELFRDCMASVKHYAELQEPSALLRLGNFYHDAGDYETAVGYYTQSANQGSGSAWFEIWRHMHYGHQGDGLGVVWGHDQSMGNVAMRAYERGVFSSSSLCDAGWEITRRSWNKGYQEKLPRLEKSLLGSLENYCSIHDVLGRLYLRAQQKKNPKLFKPEWARNHLIAHSHHSSDACSELARHFLNGQKTPQNLAKGYACAVRARAEGSPPWSQKEAWEKTFKQLPPEALELGKKLVKDKFPHGLKHRQAAERFLIKIGHLSHLSKE